MNDFAIRRLFSFRIEDREDTEIIHSLVVFLPCAQIPSGEFWDEIQHDIERNLQPNRIIFLGLECYASNQISTLQKLISQESDWRYNVSATECLFVSFASDGSLATQMPLSEQSLPISVDYFESLKNKGNREIFVRRSGLIRPHQSAHFVHPSGKHSQAFIRVANLMLYGPEVIFIASTLLKYVKENISYLWIDTSSISSLAYALVNLRCAFDPATQTPTISSFSSWTAVKSSVKFPSPKKSMVLISASTSGNLARELVQRHEFEPHQITTVFSLAKNRENSNVLCDLRDEHRIAYSDATAEYREGSCPLCAAGSQAVRFVGDQFLADDIRYTPQIVGIADAPKGLKEFMASYAGHGAVRLATEPGARAVNSIFLNTDIMIRLKAHKTKFDAACDRFISSATSTVIHLHDPESKALADAIADKFPDSARPVVLDQSQLRDAKDLKLSGAIVIVAACIGAGGALESISLDLRDISGTSPRFFLVSYSKHSHLALRAGLEANLAFNAGSYSHIVDILEKLTLPRKGTLDSWIAEHKLIFPLTADIFSLPENSSDAQIFADRIEALRKLSEGATNGLFWPTGHGDALRLRNTFAFWKQGKLPENISQADVFVTIASVIEGMRHGPKPKLERAPFHQGILAPAIFGRFNDGVIQASFLRAAASHEIDYSCDSHMSAEMSRILARIITEWDNTRGEACAEFLVALATGRLKLQKKHMSFLDQPPSGFPPVLARLCALAKNPS